jgi:multimeric flavodoxin WrbA
MKLLAVNGGPRKKWNTATLLNNVIEGAASQGAETELIHLYDLDYKGCISCFSCKLKGGKSYGRCAVKDGLAPVLDQINSVEALVLGSPIYFGEVTGATRSFLERLLFQYLVYDANHSTLFQGQIRIGLIYTMNVPEKYLPQAGYDQRFHAYEMLLRRIFGEAESLIVTDTLQFDDYSKYESSMFNVAEKTRRHEEEFPKDCQKAFDLGARLVRP